MYTRVFKITSVGAHGPRLVEKFIAARQGMPDTEEINTKRWVYLMPFPCFTLIGVLELSPLEEPFVSAFVALI